MSKTGIFTILVLVFGACAEEYYAPFFPMGFEWYAEYHESYTWAVGIYEHSWEPSPVIGTPWSFKFKCGGVLLTKTTVLTSANCIYKQKVRDGEMVVRTFDWNYPVTFSVQHPNFKSDNQQNNIAILHIEPFSMYGNPPLLANQGVQISENVTHYQPDYAELSDSTFDKQVENGQADCFIYAINETTDSILNGDLLVMQSSPTKYFPWNNCKNFFKKSSATVKMSKKMKKKSSMICTKERGPAGDRRKLCDSAPGWVLGCRDPEFGTFRLVGIQFHNQTSCAKGPNVFTKVSQYRDWIDEMLKTDLSFNHDDGGGGGGGIDP